MSNCVCWYAPLGESTQMRIVSHLTIDRYPAPLVAMTPDDPHTAMPVVYEHTDRLALAPFMTPVTADEDGAVLSWLRAHMQQADEPVLDFLARLNTAIHQEFAYTMRYAEGVQSPGETLAFGSGACRDLAWLMVEGLRQLGFATMFVTGYLYSGGQRRLARSVGATRLVRGLPAQSRLAGVRPDQWPDRIAGPDPGRRHPLAGRSRAGGRKFDRRSREQQPDCAG